MPDLFTDEYETAKKRWKKARKQYDDLVNLYDTIHNLLKIQHIEFEEATKLFLDEQTKVIKKGKNPVNIKAIKKEG